MLNCCINRKIAREERLRQQGLSTTDSSPTDVPYPDGGSESDSVTKQNIEDDDSEDLATPKDDDSPKITIRRISNKNESDSDDEFFECDDQTPVNEQGGVKISAAGKKSSPSSPSSSSGKDKAASGSKDEESDDVFTEESGKEKTEEVQEKEAELEHKPEGRFVQCGDLKLLYRDEPLYIPVTQVRSQ